ncbi:MAG: hypothetical protein MZW92_46085 [Comamonadaceae bacterium]|nr:hypothetical protein [Comamonadaceae bacterium]
MLSLATIMVMALSTSPSPRCATSSRYEIRIPVFILIVAALGHRRRPRRSTPTCTNSTWCSASSSR